MGEAIAGMILIAGGTILVIRTLNGNIDLQTVALTLGVTLILIGGMLLRRK